MQQMKELSKAKPEDDDDSANKAMTSDEIENRLENISGNHNSANQEGDGVLQLDDQENVDGFEENGGLKGGAEGDGA